MTSYLPLGFGSHQTLDVVRRRFAEEPAAVGNALRIAAGTISLQ